MGRKFKILAISDAAMCPTGYGNQMNILLTELVKRGWDVVQLAGNYWHNEKTVIGPDGYIHYNGIKLIPNEEIFHGKLYGTGPQIKEIFEREKPDIVWSLNDFHQVMDLTQMGQEFIDRWVHWLPIDSGTDHEQFYPYMNLCQNLVFLSFYGWATCAENLPNVRQKTAVYHAVQPDVYFPLSNQQEIKNKHGYGDRFVVVTVGKNQPRKMIWRCAEVMAEFMRRHEDVVWVCKSDPDEPQMIKEYPQRNLRGIMRDHLDRTLFLPQPLDFAELNDLYNSGDVFFLISGGEGFGLPTVESMLAGTPCILSDNSTSRELLGGEVRGNKAALGWLVPIEGQEKIPAFGDHKFDLADEDVALECLEQAYQMFRTDQTLLPMLGAKGRTFHRRWCSPETVTRTWEEIFRRIIRWNNKVLWHTYLGKGVGFSSVAEAIMPELEALGYDVYCHDLQSGDSPITRQELRRYYDKYLKNKMDWTNYPQIVCWLHDGFDEIRGNYKIGWSLAESTRLPDRYVKLCNRMDYIVTSSLFCRTSLQNAGVLADIRIVPPCVGFGYREMERLHYIDPSLHSVSHMDPLTTRAAPGSGGLSVKPFTYLHVGVVQDRKNPQQMLDGYCQAFPDNGRTRFVLKSNHYGHVDVLAEQYKHRKDIQFIYTDAEPYTEFEMAKLYQDADCYVNISHGEGIGMPDLEAMATGLPVVGVNWDTRGLFLNEMTGFPVKVAGLVPAYNDGTGGDNGLWADVEQESYVSILKEIAANPSVVREKGRAAARAVNAQFRPAGAAKALDELLMDIYARRHERTTQEAFGEDYYTSVHKYDASYYEGASKAILGIIGGRLQEGGLTLDLGCGRGYLIRHLLAQGVNVEGIDISEYAVKNPLPEAAGRTKLGSITEIPYPDQSVELGIAFSVLEHIPEKEVSKALSEIARVCKAAYFLIAIPLFQGHAEQLKAEDPTHVTIKPMDWWKEKFALAGLEVVAYDGAMQMVVRPKEVVTSQVRVGDRVLVGIPTKDRLDYLVKLLDSLEKQTFQDFDVLIVDDSRHEHLPEDRRILDAFDRMGKSHHIMAVRGTSHNQASAHNKILGFAVDHNYKLAFRVDDDITLEPDFMQRMFDQFLADVSCEFAAMGGIYLDPNASLVGQDVPDDWQRRPEFAGTMEPCVLNAQVFTYPPEIEERTDIQHLYSSYFYRPELVASVGGFPTDLTAMGFREETLPIYELWLKKWRLKVVTKAVGWHWNAPSGGLRSIDPNARMRMAEADEMAFRTKLAQLWAKYGGMKG